MNNAKKKFGSGDILSNQFKYTEFPIEVYAEKVVFVSVRWMVEC